MVWIAFVVAVLVFVAGAASVFLVMIGLPGTWLLLALAGLIELADSLYLPADASTTFSWWLLLACVILAGIGELLELGAGAIGAKRAGSSRRGMIASVLGGVIGAIVGAPFGLIIGSFVGAVLGTFIGAVVGEMTAKDTRIEQTIRPATGATIGRILGTLSKLPVAIAVWIALTVAAFIL